MKKQKVNVYIDGFNFYYALQNKIADKQGGWTKEMQWCNYRLLFSNFLKEGEELNKVYFFSAYRVGDKSAVNRHKAFVEALTKNWVRVVMGKYQKKTNRYKRWKHKIQEIIYNGDLKEEEKCRKLLELLAYKTYEEKETDVKIAIQILQDAFTNSYDHAYIVSWDSDITPSIMTIRNLIKQKILPKKEFSSILVPGTKWQKIRNLCDNNNEISTVMMKASIMPHQVEISENKKVCIPDVWLKQ